MCQEVFPDCFFGRLILSERLPGSLVSQTYKETMPIEAAVTMAVDECIEEDILADFFRKNKAEAIQMSIFEYDEELHKKTLLEEGYEMGIERGLSQGKAEAVLSLLEDLGTIPDAVEQTICSEKDIEVLNRWLKLASKVDSMEAFIGEMTQPTK